MERHVYPRTVVSVNHHYKNSTKGVGLVQSRPHHRLIENCSRHHIAGKIAELALNNNHSLTPSHKDDASIIMTLHI